MKVPKTFRTEKNLDGKIKYLIEKPETRTREGKVKMLLKSCEDYMIELRYSNVGVEERIAKNLSEYTKQELEIASGLIGDTLKNYNQYRCIGEYLTYLAQQVTPEGDSITLQSPFEVIGFGSYLNKDITIIIDGDCFAYTAKNMKKGTLIVEGDAGQSIGEYMEGGHIIIRGDASRSVGYRMEGGLIEVEGNAGHDTGYKMKGGKIEVLGTVGKNTGQEMRGGEIIVRCNTLDYTGESMRGGKIIIHGNTGEKTGHKMKKHAKLFVYGDIMSISEHCEGRIYHKDIIIRPDKLRYKILNKLPKRLRI